MIGLRSRLHRVPGGHFDFPLPSGPSTAPLDPFPLAVQPDVSKTINVSQVEEGFRRILSNEWSCILLLGVGVLAARRSSSETARPGSE